MLKRVALILGLLLLTLPAVAATPAELTATARYQLAETGNVTAATLDLTPQTAGDFTIELPLRGLTNPRLAYTNSDSPIEIKTEEAEVVQAGNSVGVTRLSFHLDKRPAVLQFETDKIVREYGKTTVFSLPAHRVAGIKLDYIDVLSPISRGLAVAGGQDPSNTSIGRAQQTYRFVPDQKGIPPVSLLFGTATTAELTWETRLTNGSWWWQTRQLILPPDTNQQTVFLRSIEPRPRKLRVDRDGNLIAEYRIAPKKSVTVKANALVYNRSLSYNTGNTRTFADLPDQLNSYYSTSQSERDKVVLDKVKELFDESAAKLNDDAALERGGAALTEELMTKLQSAGVPTRQVHGLRLALGGELQDPYLVSSWLESFIPGIGWMSLDPLSGLYGEADFQRLGLAITSPISNVSASGLADGLSLKFGSDPLPPSDFSKARLKLTKYIILPGISLARLQIQMPEGTVLDGAAFGGGGVHGALGSLAPLQHVNYWSLGLGASALSGGEVEFGQGGDSGLGEVLAKGPIERSYLLVIAEVGTLALAGVGVLQWRRSRRKPGKAPSLLEGSHAEDDLPAEDLLDD